MGKVEIGMSEKKFKIFANQVRRLAAKSLSHLKKERTGLEIVLANGKEMLRLNRKFRNKNKSADVLSFGETPGFVRPPKEFRRLGEIYLNASLVMKRSVPAREPMLVRLLIHGLLHTLGYTHKRLSDRIKMEAKERQLLKFLNLKSGRPR